MQVEVGQDGQDGEDMEDGEAMEDGEDTLTAEEVWCFCNLYLQFLPPINIWKKFIDLRLFSNLLVVLFLKITSNQWGGLGLNGIKLK